MKPEIIAFDKASARSYDADGRLHVTSTPISKSNVCPYMGHEIPGYDELGLDPQKIYKLYRDPVELEKGASTFNNLPLLKKHIQVGASDPKKDLVVGSIGSDVKFEPPYLKSSLCIWSDDGIAGVESGDMEQLSAAYRYVPVMESGTSPEGEAYDGRMTDIVGNHLALVTSGRAGSDVVVADENPFFNKESTVMKTTKLGKALLAVLSTVSPKLAQDSALSSAAGGAVKGKFDAKGFKAKLIALDEDIDAEKADEIIDAVLGIEDNPAPQTVEAEDEDDGGAPSKHAEIIDFLKGKGLDASDLEAVGNMLTRLTEPQGEDESISEADVDKRVETAMDSVSKALTAKFKELEIAKSAVRPVVGDVIGMDSAESVYRFALDHLGVANADMPAAGLATLFNVASSKGKETKTTIAQDASNVLATIPALAKIRRV